MVSEGIDTPNTQILCYGTAVFITPGCAFKGFYQGLLALVDPDYINICE